MGKRKLVHELAFLTSADLPKAPTVPFYEEINKVLDTADFDPFVEGLCSEYCHGTLSRPSLPPVTYFRILLLGLLLGFEPERRIALQICDSLSMRDFFVYGPGAHTPDHSTVSRTRIRIDLEAHTEVFKWVLEQLREAGLAEGRVVGVDANTLEAYEAFVQRLAGASGLEPPTREEFIDFDRKRKPKKLSNADWEHPVDPDARVAKMKDGAVRT